MSADRVVFNIRGDAQRLIVAVDFQKAVVWISGLGRTPTMTPPGPIAAIECQMEQPGRQPVDLLDLLGPSAVVAAILERTRDLTLSMIRRLHERLDISADILIRPIV